MTRASKTFIASVPKGTFYVLSREGHGFALSGESARQADELAAANFERLNAAPTNGVVEVRATQHGKRAE